MRVSSTHTWLTFIPLELYIFITTMAWGESLALCTHKPPSLFRSPLLFIYVHTKIARNSSERKELSIFSLNNQYLDLQRRACHNSLYKSHIPLTTIKWSVDIRLGEIPKIIHGRS